MAATSSSDRASDDAVHDATGRHWGDWFLWLHEHHAEELDHGAIVRLLVREGEVPNGRWCQMVTHGFEEHIGRDQVAVAASHNLAVDARRAFRSSPMRTWSLLASSAGAQAWLGATPDAWWYGNEGGPDTGDVLEIPGGERYEVMGFVDDSEIHLRTLGPLQPVTDIQLAVIGDRGRTEVELRQQGLPDEQQRLQQVDHWERALDRIAALLDED